MTILFPAGFPDKTRPVTGDDLLKFWEYSQFDLNEMSMVFGIPSRQAWYRITREQKDQPIKDTTIALLLRLFAAHPELIPIKRLDLTEVAAKFDLGTPDLAVLLGRSALSGRDWDSGTEALMSVQIAARALLQGSETNPNFLAELRATSELERNLLGKKGANHTISGNKTKRIRRSQRVMQTENTFVQDADDLLSDE